jgi:hypothetical protein
MREESDKRASPRVPAKISVRVEGRDRNHQPVSEETHTLLINQGGARLALAAEFQLNDRIKITIIVDPTAKAGQLADSDEYTRFEPLAPDTASFKISFKDPEVTSRQCRIAWRSVAKLKGRWSYGIALIDSTGNFWEAAKPAK